MAHVKLGHHRMCSHSLNQFPGRTSATIYSKPHQPAIGWHGLILGLIMLAAALILTGCTTANTTNPPRSATEQLLLSTAADHAITNADFTLFQNKNVYLDTTYFDSYDSKYAIGDIRDALSQAGARLIDNMTNADVIVQCRSGALSIDSSESMFGIPASAAPVPLAGSVAIPEIAFYKATRQHSYAKFALLAYNRTSREHLYSSGPMDGKSYYKHYRLLFISWKTTDIPEKK